MHPVIKHNHPRKGYYHGSTIVSSASAAHHLKQNQKSLQGSLTRLSSGKRINGGADDPGGLAVAMKLNASIKRLAGAENNAQNTLSFMEVQDGLLKTAGDIVTRISELKGLHSDDPLKSTANQTSYDTELTDLVAQLNDIAAATFNGESLFGTTAITLNYDEDATADITIAGSDFATAITDISSASSFDEGNGGLAVATIDTALENVANLRAQNGSGQNRLQFTAESLSLQKNNMTAALDRIEGVNLAEETSNLAKHSILTQASAAIRTGKQPKRHRDDAAELTTSLIH